jgi:hypothetical protein
LDLPKAARGKEKEGRGRREGRREEEGQGEEPKGTKCFTKQTKPQKKKSHLLQNNK